MHEWMNEWLNKPVSRPWAPCSPRSTPPPSRTRISPPQGIHLDPGVPVDPYAFLEQIYTVYPGTETQFIPGTCKQFLPQVRSTLFPQDPMVSVMHTALGALDGLVRGLVYSTIQVNPCIGSDHAIMGPIWLYTQKSSFAPLF